MRSSEKDHCCSMRYSTWRHGSLELPQQTSAEPHSKQCTWCAMAGYFFISEMNVVCYTFEPRFNETEYYEVNVIPLEIPTRSIYPEPHFNQAKLFYRRMKTRFVSKTKSTDSCASSILLSAGFGTCSARPFEIPALNTPFSNTGFSHRCA